MQLKILMINNFHYLRGGDCRYTFDLTSILKAQGHEVVHFAMHHPQNENCEHKHFFIKYIDYDLLSRQKNLRNAYRVLRTSFWNRESQQNLSRLLDEFKPDIAHLQNILHHITPSVIPLLRKNNIPIVHHLHDYNLICPDIYLLNKGQICEKCFQGRYYHCIIKKCKKGSLSASILAAAQRYFHELNNAFKGVSCFITPTEFARNKFHEAGFIARDRIVTIPHFVKFETVKPTQDFDSTTGAVFAGRLITEKGLDTLLKAAEIVPDIPIYIYGDGPLKAEIERNIREKNLQNVAMMGWRPQKDILDAYRQSRCVVMPSEWYETAGLSVLEAAAVGKAAVASSNTAMAEFIKDGINGLVFEMGNAESLAAAIRKTCNDADFSKEMGSKARLYVEQEYSAEVHYKRIMAVYLKGIRETQEQLHSADN